MVVDDQADRRREDEIRKRIPNLARLILVPEQQRGVRRILAERGLQELKGLLRANAKINKPLWQTAHVTQRQRRLLAETAINITTIPGAVGPANAKGNVGVAHVERLLVFWSDDRKVLVHLWTGQHFADREQNDGDKANYQTVAQWQDEQANCRHDHAQKNRTQTAHVVVDDRGDKHHERDDQQGVEIDDP